jgi:two-component system CheB/CheR fusion protein
VELLVEGARLVLRVRDDGVGMAARHGDGLGLHMMEYRAKMLGAVLEVQGGKPRGTIVTCSLPITATGAALA